VNSCPARIPLSIRIVDPEFPQSSGIVGSFSSRPLPTTSTAPSSFGPSARRQLAPNPAMHPSVLAQSCAAEKFRNRLVPSAIAASIAYRCEIDLSPGIRTDPSTPRAGRMTSIEEDINS